MSLTLEDEVRQYAKEELPKIPRNLLGTWSRWANTLSTYGITHKEWPKELDEFLDNLKDNKDSFFDYKWYLEHRNKK